VSELPLAPPAPGGDCWNRVGVRGDRSCPELPRVGHCHNCPVFAAAGRRFLDAAPPEGYLEEWTERLAAPPEEGPSETCAVLTFRLGEEWLALEVAVLVEVTTPRPVRRVPHRGGLLAGLVNIRGELHLCARLEQLLGLEAAVSDVSQKRPGGQRFCEASLTAARLLVVRHGGEHWVFPVDAVGQVHRFATAELRRVPATVARSPGHLTRGVFSWEGRPVGYLDEARLFEALRARVR
jgi:chemotaxis-related protein WspD